MSATMRVEYEKNKTMDERVSMTTANMIDKRVSFRYRLF